MAYQEHFPPPEPRPDPRYLQPHIQSSMSSAGSMPDLEPRKSRDNSVAQDGYTSDSSRYSRARAPINEAVNSAFTNSTATANAIPAELLQQLTSQITANVIQQLKATNLSVPAEAKSSTGGSPPIDRAAVYTPPSPFPSGEPQRSPGRNGLGFDMPNGISPPQTATKDRSSPPLSQAIQPEDERNSRPKGPQRIATGEEMTVVEKIWGTLFNEQGEATPRLSQFLRGIAMHLINDYEPKDSLVVTPGKMQRYYEETKLDSEVYPWQVIFDDRTSSISRMLRELDVRHHLVQESPSERPDIPALTPEGFATWYTHLIKAHPNQEYERLAKTVLDMPVNNPDNKSERFPKELSRRLFPGRGEAEIEERLCKSISVHCNVKLESRHNSNAQSESKPEPEPRASNAGHNSTGNGVPPPPRDSQSSNGKTSTTRPQSFSGASASGAAVESEGEDTLTPQPIERERKPYAAQPGGGKEYNNVPPPAPAPVTDLRPPAADTSKLRRSTSNREPRPRQDDYGKHRPTPISVQQVPGDSAGSAPIEIPESRHRHRNSAYYRDPPPNGAVPRRARSPSLSKESKPSVRYSEPVFDQYAGAGSAPIDLDREREKRYRDYETQRERLAGDRYDSARMAAYDPRDRDRERGDARPRGQSVASYGHADDEYYRSVGGYPPPDRARDGGPVGGAYGTSAGSYVTPNGPHYPPNSYRETR